MAKTVEVEGTTFTVEGNKLMGDPNNYKFRFNFQGGERKFSYLVLVDMQIMAGMGIMTAEEAERMAYMEMMQYVTQGRTRDTTLEMTARETRVREGIG